MQFLYFLPSAIGAAVSADDIQKAGLGYALPGPVVSCGVGKGPGDLAGVIYANGGANASRVGYSPEDQAWVRIPNITAWVGMYRDQPPQPDDLLRKRTLPGHWVEAANGSRWLIPAARAWKTQGERSNTLPRITVVDESGNWSEGSVMPTFAALWDWACAWWDAKTGAVNDGGVLRFDFSGINDAATVALQANYRIGKAEVGLLGLFTRDVVTEILDAIIDWPTLASWADSKKGPGADGSSSEPGPQVATNTAQP